MCGLGELGEVCGVDGWEVAFFPEGVDVGAGSIGGEVDVEKAIAVDIGGGGGDDEELLAEVGELAGDVLEAAVVVLIVEGGFKGAADEGVGVAIVVKVSKEDKVDAVTRSEA